MGKGAKGNSYWLAIFSAPGYNRGCMSLLDWVESQGGRGRGVVARLVRRSGISSTTVSKVLKGGRVRDLKVARALSRATGHRVTVRDLMQLTDEDCSASHRRKREVA